MHISNAKIESTILGFEGHGILTSYIYFENQAYGGYALHKYACAGWVKGILETLGKEKWEDLPGTYVRIERESEMGKILRIGHIIEDRWFSIDDVKEKQ